MSMNDGNALLASIIANPAEDTPRLMFADYLEETGDRESRDRAAFIRVQIEISHRPNMMCTTPHPLGVQPIEATWHRFTAHCRCGACTLRRREYNLSKRYCVW